MTQNKHSSINHANLQLVQCCQMWRILRQVAPFQLWWRVKIRCVRHQFFDQINLTNSIKSKKVWPHFVTYDSRIRRIATKSGHTCQICHKFDAFFDRWIGAIWCDRSTCYKVKSPNLSFLVHNRLQNNEIQTMSHIQAPIHRSKKPSNLWQIWRVCPDFVAIRRIRLS